MTRCASFRTPFLVACLLVSTSLLYAQSHPGSETASPEFNSIAQQAAAAREQGHNDEAIRLYRGAVKLNPRYAEGWWYIGTLLYDQDHFSEAIPALKTLVALDPKLGPAYAFLGLCEFETMDYKSALLHLERAHALGGGDPEAIKVADYHLALLLNRAGEFDRAAAVLAPQAASGEPPEQVQVALGMSLLHVPLLPTEVDPSKDALLHAAGSAAAALVRNDAPAATQALQQLTADYSDTPFVHYAYGAALMSVDRNQEAAGQLRDEIKLNPASPLPQMELALIDIKTQHGEQAVAEAQRAVQLAAKSPAAHRVMAKALAAAGKRQQAEAELALAKRLGTELPLASTEIARLYRRSTGPGAGPVANSSTSASFETLSHQAEAARQSGNPQEAARDYDAALKLRRRWPEGWWNLGTLEFQAQQYGEATTAFKNVVELNPNHSEAWALLGISEYATGDYKNALLHLDHGRRLGYKGNEAALRVTNYRYATLLILNGEFDKAIDALTPEVARGAPGDDLKIAFGLALLRIPELPEKLDPSRIPLVRDAGEAAVLLAGSKYDQAFPIIDTLVKQYPSTPYLHCAYGMALASISRYDEAEAQLQQEIRLQPQAELPYTNLALIYVKTYRTEQALPLATKAVELAPKSAEAHYVLGRALLDSSKTDESIKQLELATQIKPGSPEIHFNLARAYTKAKLADQAKRERETFARLNAIAEREKSANGSQVYGQSADRGQLAPQAVDPTSPAPQ